MSKGLDGVGWYIATMHGLLGHDKTAVIIGQDAGNPKHCILCQYEKGQVDKAAVIEQIGV